LNCWVIRGGEISVGDEVELVGGATVEHRAVRYAFLEARRIAPDVDFLDIFRASGCYMVDLCGTPVDRLGRTARAGLCQNSEARLAGYSASFGPR